MEKTSAFYTWLSEQTAREDEVGAIAARAMGDEGWPRQAAKKEELRTYLRSKGEKRLVAPLAIALDEFHDEVGEPLWQSSGLDNIAAPLFFPWRELGSPDLEEVEKRAEEGNPAALALVGLRLCLGIEMPQNVILGERYLERAFEGGCIPAAAVLDRMHAFDGDGYESARWATAGARAGDHDCLRELCLRADAEIEFHTDAFPEGFLENELPALLAKHFGQTGEDECLRAVALVGQESQEAKVQELLRASAAKNWLPAYRVLTNLLDQSGEDEEAEAWAAKGAALGEPSSLALIASRKLQLRIANNEIEPSPEGTELVGQMETAAEQGVDEVLVWLAIFYSRGEHVPADEAKATKYAAAALLAVGNPQQQADRITALRHAPQDTPAGAEWLFACADKFHSLETRTVAANAWVATGLEEL